MKFDTHFLILLFTGAFFSILFLQSALDKVFNWKSELDFNKLHFNKTFVKPIIPLVLAMLTFLELSSGLLSIAGLFMILTKQQIIVSFYASCLCAGTLLCLFLGQRISKDYAGAQSLVSYFIVSLIGVYFAFPC